MHFILTNSPTSKIRLFSMEYILLSSSLVAIAITTTLLYKYLKHNQTPTQYYPPLPPGPAGYPIIGCLPDLVRNKPTFRWIHNYMQRLNTEIACIRVGNVHLIPVTSPELAREFLKEQDAIFASRPEVMTARLTSDGFLTAALAPAGDQWRKMKRLVVSEVLSAGVYEWLHAKRNEEADHLVRYVYNQCRNPEKNGVVNVRDVARHYCSNVTRKMVFGERFFGDGERDGGPGIEEREHMDGLFTVLSYVYGFAVADYVPWLEVFDFDGHKKIMIDAIRKVRKYQDLEIVKRIEMWKGGVRDTNEDILDVFINLKDSENNPLLSVQEIKAQVSDIIQESIDNPSNAVEWCIGEVMNKPHILDRVCKELDQVVGRERLVQESDLSQLNYMKACIKESFRLHPTAPFNVPHASIKDTVVGGYFIPKGSHVLLSRIGLGRNPRVWEDPLTFKPERHITDESSGVSVTLVDPELRMLSFSTGRRGCPAVELGSTMATMLLARLIQGFIWRSPEPIHLAESTHDLLMANPLIVHAMPRLEPNLYQRLI